MNRRMLFAILGGAVFCVSAAAIQSVAQGDGEDTPNTPDSKQVAAAKAKAISTRKSYGKPKYHGCNVSLHHTLTGQEKDDAKDFVKILKADPKIPHRAKTFSTFTNKLNYRLNGWICKVMSTKRLEGGGISARIYVSPVLLSKKDNCTYNTECYCIENWVMDTKNVRITTVDFPVGSQNMMVFR